MRRARTLAGVLAAAALAGAPGAADAARPASPVAVTVQARPGQSATAVRALSRGALRVTRRHGDRLQVIAAPGRRAALGRLPGVAAAYVAPAAFGDEDPEEGPITLGTGGGTVISEGLDRTGADELRSATDGGRGLVVAVLDLGFGTSLEARQLAGELPPAARLEVRSFDGVAGLAGTNAYGNATNHGELVAQTVFDYVPQARFVFVNYHTEQDFEAATDYLVQRRPDVVVHSNSFIEGPFDGTGAPARAVDRAAAAGILWVNSAGNYGERHWSGAWVDADLDGVLDWPGDPGWAFTRDQGQPISFALSWAAPRGAQAPDLDLVLERQQGDGSWTAVAVSGGRQPAGAGPAERIIGHLANPGGLHRLRVVHVSGPAPAGPLTLFSREIPMASIGGGGAGSVPTPGDAAGSLTVGAVDWRGNRPKPYSSQGPTDDGRLKPDLVAPTNTRLAGPTGPREVGGTSNAAPNAAGVAALLVAAQRAAGLNPGPAAIRELLAATALDLGAPGPDAAFGAGRLRADVDAPAVAPAGTAAGVPVRGVVRLRAQIDDASRVASWSLALDGVPLAAGPTDTEPAARVDTRTLADGAHRVTANAADWPGNAGVGGWTMVVDNRRPSLVVRRVEVFRPTVLLRRAAATTPRRAATRPPPPPPPRRVRIVVAARDADRRPLSGTLRLTGPGGAVLIDRAVRLPRTEGRLMELGRLRTGRYAVRVTAADRAGNRTVAGRTITVP